MARSAVGGLEGAWIEARAGRGRLVLVGGAESPRVASALGALASIARRDGGRVHALGAAESDALPAAAGFEAAIRVAEALRAASAAAPQLVLLEHAERAPVASLHLLAILGRELRDTAVLLVATRGDAPVEATRERALADLARAGTWLSLDRVGPDASEPAHADAPAFTMTREGRHWTLARGAQRATLRDSQGLRILSVLTREPGRAWRALDLVERGDDDAGEALDAPARAAYRRELASLRDAVEHGTASGAESAFLTRELARDTGLGGRARRLDSSAERARVAVAQSLRRALAAVRAADPELAAWLAASLRTGHACSFDPRGA